MSERRRLPIQETILRCADREELVMAPLRSYRHGDNCEVVYTHVFKAIKERIQIQGETQLFGPEEEEQFSTKKTKKGSSYQKNKKYNVPPHKHKNVPLYQKTKSVPVHQRTKNVPLHQRNKNMAHFQRTYTNFKYKHSGRCSACYMSWSVTIKQAKRCVLV